MEENIKKKILAEKQIHEHGFVRLLEVMGSDETIEESARLSYGEGTRKKSETRGLLRYLLKHKHTSPFEQAEVRFHIKLPIFVMRELVRHRTANLNEYSGRYSVMDHDYYIPADDYIKPQSKTNKQGRDNIGKYSNEELTDIKWMIENSCHLAFQTYDQLIQIPEIDPNTFELGRGFGVAREIGRICLPVNGYTQCIWKCDLHNFLHFIKLRTEPSAQREIRDYADAMYEMVKVYFPITCEAFEDFTKNSVTFSQQEYVLLAAIIRQSNVSKIIDIIFDEENGHDNVAAKWNLSKRDLTEFLTKINYKNNL